jgi:pyruvate/2-oxoglutarate dehydrogenase complex dihydrolipoamide dehydrogenase (E3) component
MSLSFSYHHHHHHHHPVSIGIHRGAEYGIDMPKSDFKLNWGAIKDKRDAYVHRLNGIYKTNMENEKITLLTGHAKFTSKNTVDVNGTEYTAKHVNTPHLIITHRYSLDLTLMMFV